MAPAIDGKARELIEAPNFCYVATLRSDGRPHVTITWIDLDDGKVVLNSAEGRVWPANLRRDQRVTLTVADRENQYEYVSIDGRLAEETHDGADENINKLSKKYLGQDEYPFRQPGEQRVMFTIEPERVRVYPE